MMPRVPLWSSFVRQLRKKWGSTLRAGVDLIEYYLRSIRWHARYFLNVFRKRDGVAANEKHLRLLKQIGGRDPEDGRLVAIHGMERSGTNFLAQCLESLEICVVNKYVRGRENMAHKHHRWGYSAEEMPPFYLGSYQSRNIALNQTELNQKSGLPAETKHVIIKKERVEAVASFINFGIRGLHYKTKKEALNCVFDVAEDYRKFYDFWERLAATSRGIILVDYHDIVAEPLRLISLLSDAGCTLTQHPTVSFTFQSVNMSPKSRKRFVATHEVQEILREH